MAPKNNAKNPQFVATDEDVFLMPIDGVPAMGTKSPWPKGQYRFQVKAIKQDIAGDKPAAIVKLKCLTAPEGCEGKVGQDYDQYFFLKGNSDDPQKSPLGFYIGFCDSMLPEGFSYSGDTSGKLLAKGKNGGTFMRQKYIHGGKSGEGAIFDVDFVEETYKPKKGPKKGEEITQVRLGRGSYKLVTPASTFLEDFGLAGGASADSADDEFLPE